MVPSSTHDDGGYFLSVPTVLYCHGPSVTLVPLETCWRPGWSQPPAAAVPVAPPVVGRGAEPAAGTRSVESVRRSCADWRDVTQEQDALLQQHTIQTEHRRKKSWTRRGKLVRVALLTRRILSGFFCFCFVFSSDPCVWIPAFTPLAEQRHLDGVCTHRNFIQAFVSGMLAS